MGNETQINPQLNNTTVINPNLSDYSQREGVNVVSTTTAVNTVANNSGNIIRKGTILGDGYLIVGLTTMKSGEADIYVCQKDKVPYIAKVYRREKAVKDEVIQILRNLDSPYVAKIFASGVYERHPYEIITCYKNGSLKGKTFSYEELKKRIIPDINEGLRVIHQTGMVHKDLKPANIMLHDNMKDVAIIDFGISSVKSNDNTVIVTNTGMTPEYSAPETFRNLFLSESDYYSLGITIYELYFGKTPYSGMNSDEIEKYVSIQKIPFPDNTPKDLRDLITALTYSDITNRKDLSNPNRRWGYKEVKNWCEGKEQVLPGEGVGFTLPEKAIAPYKFLGESYTDMSLLVTALALNWKEGKKQLYRGILSGFFKPVDPEIAGYCIDAEEAVEKGGSEDLFFFKTLYKLDADTTRFYWYGKVYDSLEELGKSVLGALWNANYKVDPFIGNILRYKILSEYCAAVGIEDENILNAVKGLETSFAAHHETLEERTRVYYLLAYMLSGNKQFYFKGERFDSIEELASFMRDTAENNYEEFSSFCEHLMDSTGVLDSQFESWLISIGKQAEISRWRRALDN